MEFLIQDSETKKIYDMSEVVGDISYTDTINNGASKLTFNYLLVDNKKFNNGSIVRFKYNDSNIFYGYIFRTEVTKSEKIQVIAYDQLRYLKTKDTIELNGYTLDKLVKTECDKFLLKYGILDCSKYILRDKKIDNKTLLDIIYEAIDEVLISTKDKYILRDNFGAIEVLNVSNLKLPVIFGDESLVYDYKYEQSIDNNTYNTIKLNTKVISSDNISRWGVLQYYEKVNGNFNEAQIKEKANNLLRLYNREEKKLSLSVLGDVRVRAGDGIFCIIRDVNINSWFIVNEVTHRFKKDIHTMELDVIIYD